MHVLEPKELETRRIQRAKKQHKKRKLRAFILSVLLVTSIYSSFALLMPIPMLKVIAEPPRFPVAMPVELSWPSYGQAAIGADGYGLIGQSGDEKPVPIASTNKVLTALAILQAKPYNAESPAIIKLTEADVATYEKYSSEGQSVIPVFAGQEISQYQALQALLLPSANNIADALVKWAFGSTEEYLKYANNYAKKINMTNTVVADASGFSPQTVSTAKDLVVLAEHALANPIISEIVEQPYADFPDVGRIYSRNVLLNREGIIGIKTGNTDEAGGCYMFAAKRNIDDINKKTIYGAIVGAPNLERAMADALPLLNSGFSGFITHKYISSDQTVGKVVQPKGPDIVIRANKDVSVVTWKGSDPIIKSNIKKRVSRLTAGESLGTISVLVGKDTYNVELAASTNTIPITAKWRLRHAAGYL